MHVTLESRLFKLLVNRKTFCSVSCLNFLSNSNFGCIFQSKFLNCIFKTKSIERVHQDSCRPLLTSCPWCVFLQLIRRCRSTNPAHRPTFEQVKKFVHRINPIKVSPVDMMMSLVTTSGHYSSFSLTLTSVQLFAQMTQVFFPDGKVQQTPGGVSR